MRRFSLGQKISIGAALVLLFLNVLVWPEVFSLAGPHYLTVSALDVGQGDAIFIQTPDTRDILIDGGPDSTVLQRLQERLPFWDKHLDIILLTHPDSDHLNGLLQVLQKYKVDYIVWTGIVRGGVQYQKWLDLISLAQKKGTHIMIGKLGDHIKNGQVTLTILHPFTNISGQDFRPKNDDNDTGIVSRLEYGKTSFLFTADISSTVEQVWRIFCRQ